MVLWQEIEYLKYLARAQRFLNNRVNTKNYHKLMANINLKNINNHKKYTSDLYLENNITVINTYYFTGQNLQNYRFINYFLLPLI